MTNNSNVLLDKDENLDPITFEVVRHKLQAIVEEQAITLKAVSGSPVVTDATDFNCGLYLADGSIVAMGPQVLFHSGTMSTVIQSIIESCSDNPGINEGDMFILNDPYCGAIHQPDVSIVAPIFHEGQHIAWAGACAHQLDTGGMSFGSWAYGATEIQQEAMLFPGVKIVEAGEIRQDIWRMIMGMTRLPQVVGLDLKAMIAANNVATRRYFELMERYGQDAVRQVMYGELDTSEQRLRERLSIIPDGTYRARDFIEHDGHSNRLYEICVAIEKRGDTLTFDMEGTSPQASGFINCTYSGMKGAIFSGLLPILAPDIRWNQGLMRPVSIQAEEGIICNAKWPAPVSGATVSTAWVVSNVTVAALSRMVGGIKEWAREGQGVTKGQMSVMTFSGRDRDESPYGFFFMDSMAGGGGAFVDHDGLDGSGDYVVPRPAIANVEVNEASGPILYLHRSFLPDTAGAGRMRGGNTTGLAIVPYDTDEIQAMIIGHGVEVPNSIGLFGGMPGGCATHALRRGKGESIGELIEAFYQPEQFMDAADDLGAKPGNMALHSGDIIGYSFQGGGGYGDPLLRAPDQVADDVALGMVSSQQAEQLYGVIIANGKIDKDATEQLRLRLRTERIGKAPTSSPSQEDEDNLPNLRIGKDRHIRCACGSELARPGADWKDSASVRELSAEASGKYVRLHEDLMMKEFACKECATLLEVEVLRKDEAPLVTMQIDA